MFHWLKRLTCSPPTSVTHAAHYEQASRSAPGSRCRLTLIHLNTDGSNINLIYRWHDDLTDKEADNLDTRVRAYIACAIYDAAVWMAIPCQSGPPHGQRPSWIIPGYQAPVSLIFGGFNVSDKTCKCQVGCGMAIMGMSPGYHPNAHRLTRGFKECFSEITV